MESAFTMPRNTQVERGGGFHPRCDQPTLDKFHAVTVSHPSFPFTYYALSECAFEAGKDTWRQYTDRALGILERTIPSCAKTRPF